MTPEDANSDRREAKGHSELALRVISAIVLIAIFLPLLWLGGRAFLAMCLVLSLVLFYEWARILLAAKRDSYSLVWWGIGAIYALIPLLLLPNIRENSTPAGILLILFLFLIIAVTDVAAYFFGRAIGGPKLWQRISPKKTWSGALGGLGCAVIVGAGFGHIVWPDLILLSAVGAAVLSIFSQIGDLFESSFKRRFGVKDSSNLIPGHGGFMDRLDGLLFAAIPLAVYTFLTAI